MANLKSIQLFKFSSFVLGAAFLFVCVAGLAVPARAALKFFRGSSSAVSLGATFTHWLRYCSATRHLQTKLSPFITSRSAAAAYGCSDVQTSASLQFGRPQTQRYKPASFF